MKKYSIVSALLIIFLFQVGCEKDYLTPKKVDIDFPVSFTNDIIPILTEDCAIPSCHVNGGTPPNLTAAKAYEELTGLGYVDTTNAEQSILYVRITSTLKPMPPTERLTSEEIAYILAWIKQGAQTN